MAELPLLVNITVALAYALVGGLRRAARRACRPSSATCVAGVALGPFTPGFHGDAGAIDQLAEFGVILLMFGVGLHFSFRDLWQVRDVAIPGAVAADGSSSPASGYCVAARLGLSTGGALVLGLAISVASTVVLLRA